MSNILILWVSVSYITRISREKQDIKVPDIRAIYKLISGDIRCVEKTSTVVITESVRQARQPAPAITENIRHSL